jgi:hypothetical protein
MTHAPSIPNELLQELRDATDKFHRSRRELERWMDASEYRHQERVAKADAAQHEAERDLLDVEERIRRVLAAAKPDSADIQH